MKTIQRIYNYYCWATVEEDLQILFRPAKFVYQSRHQTDLVAKLEPLELIFLDFESIYRE